MVDTLFLLAAASALQPATAPVPAPAFRPTATARAAARIQILRGVEFGPSHLAVPPSALRRSARLTDYDGQVRAAELLEFQ